MTYENNLDKWAKEHIKDYVGVFSRDDFNKAPIFPGASYIINLDKSTGQGTHWTALRISNKKPKTALYVDSFGIQLPSDITKVLWDKGYKIFYSDIQNQMLNEENCGLRVLSALRDMATAKNDIDEFLRISEEK